MQTGQNVLIYAFKRINFCNVLFNVLQAILLATLSNPR